MTELILHQYDFSNFSEKVRLIFGLKNLTWRAVEIPSHLPKPEYTPLTGGYRRTPALQIGADVYCDTHLIADELENRCPEPSLFGETNQKQTKALSECLSPWAEGPLLWPAALYITGVHADKFPRSFHSDRARLHNKPQPSVEQVRASGLKYEQEMTAQMRRIEELLAHGDAFLLGPTPTLADLTVYGAPWLLEKVGGRSPLFDALPKTRAWLGRVASIGHGEHQPLAAKQALEIATNAAPIALGACTTLPQGVHIGDKVTVAPRDENSPARGELMQINEKRIVIRVNNEYVNNIHVHFPRIGYRVSKQR